MAAADMMTHLLQYTMADLHCGNCSWCSACQFIWHCHELLSVTLELIATLLPTKFSHPQGYRPFLVWDPMIKTRTLQWRHNGQDSVLNHQPQDCLNSSVRSGATQRKHQSSASLACVWGIHRGPVNSPHKWPVTRKMFPFHDVIMTSRPCLIVLLMFASLSNIWEQFRLTIQYQFTDVALPCYLILRHRSCSII